MYEERNRKIKEHGKATRERHCQMDCRVFSVKIQENRTSKAKLEKLNRCFLEAKWLRNAVVATETLSLEDTSHVQVKVKDRFEVRKISSVTFVGDYDNSSFGVVLDYGLSLLNIMAGREEVIESLVERLDN